MQGQPLKRAFHRKSIFLIPDKGLMLAEYLDGYETMSADKFNSRPGAAERAGNVFGRLHKSGKEFAFTCELFSMIKDYLATSNV